jgi:hypothetical protein
VIKPDASSPMAGDGGEANVNPLCGALTCNPDDARSCVDFEPASAEQVTSLGGAGGAAGAAGASGVTNGGNAGGFDAGAGGQRGALGGAGAGGAGAPGAGFGGTTDENGGAGGAGPQAPTYACRVVREDPRPVTECAPSGRGQAGAPCFDSEDCASGLGCVSVGAIGRCRPFCCSGESSCDRFPGTYCAERELLEDPVPATALKVPVCITADRCDLAKEPCAMAGQCECIAPTACQVVRPDGTTACVVPGEGAAGMPCPCKYGYVCSRAADRCLALCRPSSSSTWPSGCGRCQASAELPEGWGVCLGD